MIFLHDWKKNTLQVQDQTKSQAFRVEDKFNNLNVHISLSLIRPIIQEDIDGAEVALKQYMTNYRHLHTASLLSTTFLRNRDWIFLFRCVFDSHHDDFKSILVTHKTDLLCISYSFAPVFFGSVDVDLEMSVEI